MVRAALLLALLSLCTAHIDPECHMNTPQLIRYHGYPAETHYVTTSDGYILQLHRIPGPRHSTVRKPSPVAFLQHGLLDASSTWVLNYPSQSLGFILADHGFDVWLGNIRGNTYSTNHTTLSTKDPLFWDFSFDEMAAIDLPEMIEYVLNTVNAADLMYVGHSQGTEIAFIEFSRNKELAQRINFYVALAPVARITHVEGFFKWISWFVPTVEEFLEKFGINEFMPSYLLLKEFSVLFCPLVHETLCEEVFFALAGFDADNFNSSRIPVYGSHCPAGTSVKNMLHWYQIFKAGVLQAWDFGNEKENIVHYNSTTPPQYDVSTLNVPTMFAAGGNDFLGDPRDLAWLEAQMAPGLLVHNIFLDEYNHLDLIWGLDVADKVYKYILEEAKHLGVW